MNDLKQTFVNIIELSKKLHESDENWYYKVAEPISRGEIMKIQQENNAILPDEFIKCMTVSNGFTVDFSSSVGYFHLYAAEKTAPQGKHSCIGWHNHKCLYYNSLTGEFFIENERYKYTPITDFNREILIPVENYLKQQLIYSERRHELLEKQKDNPLREYFDKFMEYRNSNQNITMYPPASEEEIADWEKEHVKLPEFYRNWMLLTNGCSIDFLVIYSLDHIFLEEVCWSEDEEENKEYWYLATTDGCGTCLLLDPESGKVFEFDHDSYDPWTEIDGLDLLFDDQLEYIEEDM